MTREVSQKRKSTEESDQSTFSSGSRFCPRCGSEIVTTGQGVAASFPSPAIERLVCSDSACNYVKYVKLDSTGFTPEGSPANRRGEQGAE